MHAGVAQLVAGLSDPDLANRCRAAEQLARLGPEAREAAIPLVRACGDEAQEVREWAVGALEELGPPLALDVEALASLLADGNAGVGYWAATLLGRLEREAATAVPALAAALSGFLDTSVRQRAAWALGQIGSPAAVALEALGKAADSDDARLARLARRAIDRIGR